MATQRLTRKERQARTRSSLIDSAGHVFSERGMEHASIDEVAEHAGFTKGAFYANFKSKEELFLAMLDENFAERVSRRAITLTPARGARVVAREREDAPVAA